jgi:hypothetical protein
MGEKPEAADLKHELLLRADRRREKQPVEHLGPDYPWMSRMTGEGVIG